MKKTISFLTALAAAMSMTAQVFAADADWDEWFSTLPAGQISEIDWTALADVAVPTPTPVPVKVDFDMEKVQYPAHWLGAFSDSSAASNETFIASTDKDSHSGDRSLYFKIGKQQGTFSFVTDLLESTDASKTYRLEFWAKGADGTDKRFGASIADGTNNNTGYFAWNVVWDLYGTSELGEDNWRKYTYDFTEKSISAIGLQLWDVNEVLFDDFKLYELSGDVSVRELAIVNGDMEDHLDFNEASDNLYNDNWRVRYNSVSGIQNDNVRFEDIGGGNYAMHIRYNSITAANTYLEITNNFNNGQLVSGKAYTVEYDIKQSSRGELGSMVFFPLRMWNYSQYYRIEAAAKPNGTTKSVTALDNGFKHIVKEFTSSVNGDAVFGILAQSCGDLIIDNIKVYASDDETMTNLIVDSGFDDIYEVPSNESSGYENRMVINPESAEMKAYIINSSDVGQEYSIYVAQYDGEDNLLDITEDHVNVDGRTDTPVEHTVTPDKLHEDTKSIKGFIWGGSNGVIPLANAKEQLDYKRSFKVLAIGNSFSVDALEYLYQIAESYGVEEIVIGNLYIGGCSLEMHWNNALLDKAAYEYYKNSSGTFVKTTSSMRSVLEEEQWDIIMMQQVSGLSGKVGSYEPYLTKLKEYVRQHSGNPKAKLAWHMTWAYQQGASHADFPKYNSDQMTMYNAITAAVRKRIVPDSDFEYIIPSGTSIQNVRASFIGDNLNRDGYHLTDPFGRYVAALTVFKTLTGYNIDNINYAPSGVREEYVAAAKKAVDNAAKEPFNVIDPQ